MNESQVYELIIMILIISIFILTLFFGFLSFYKFNTNLKIILLI